MYFCNFQLFPNKKRFVFSLKSAKLVSFKVNYTILIEFVIHCIKMEHQLDKTKYSNNNYFYSYKYNIYVWKTMLPIDWFDNIHTMFLNQKVEYKFSTPQFVNVCCSLRTNNFDWFDHHYNNSCNIGFILIIWYIKFCGRCYGKHEIIYCFACISDKLFGINKHHKLL